MQERGRGSAHLVWGVLCYFAKYELLPLFLVVALAWVVDFFVEHEVDDSGFNRSANAFAYQGTMALCRVIGGVALPKIEVPGPVYEMLNTFDDQEDAERAKALQKRIHNLYGRFYGNGLFTREQFEWAWNLLVVGGQLLKPVLIMGLLDSIIDRFHEEDGSQTTHLLFKDTWWTTLLIGTNTATAYFSCRLIFLYLVPRCCSNMDCSKGKVILGTEFPVGQSPISHEIMIWDHLTRIDVAASRFLWTGGVCFEGIGVLYEDLGFNEDLASRLMIAALALVCGGGVAYFEWKKFKPAQSGSAPLSCQFNRGRHVTSWMARCFAYSSVASGVFALTLLGAKKVYAWQWGSWLPIALGSIFGVSSATVFGFADIGKDLRCHDLEDTQNPPYNKVRQYKDQLSFYQDVILRSLTEPVLMSIAFLLKGPNVLYGILLLPMVWATEYTVFEIKRSWGQIEDHHSKVVELRGHAQAEQESNEQGQVPASPRSAQAFLDAKEQEALVASKGIRGGHAHSFSHPGEYTDLADKVRQDDVMAFFVTG